MTQHQCATPTNILALKHQRQDPTTLNISNDFAVVQYIDDAPFVFMEVFDHDFTDDNGTRGMVIINCASGEQYFHQIDTGDFNVVGAAPVQQVTVSNSGGVAVMRLNT